MASPERLNHFSVSYNNTYLLLRCGLEQDQVCVAVVDSQL